jgi:amino acid transporter
VLTLPAAGAVAGGVWKGADAVGSGATGYAIMAAVAAAAAGAPVLRDQAPRRGACGGRLMLATVVDTGAVLKILLGALIVGAGVTAISGLGVRATARIGRARRQGHTGEVVGDAFMIAIAAFVCLAALAVGFIAMTHKS